MLTPVMIFMVYFCTVFYTPRLDMGDRLVELLKCFELRARVFQAGPLCRSARYDAADGLG